MNSIDHVILGLHIQGVLDKNRTDRARAIDMGFIVGYATANDYFGLDKFSTVIDAYDKFVCDDYDGLKNTLSALF